MGLFDLHVHTVRGSSDSSLTPQQLIDEAERIGLTGVCLTEHGGGWSDGEFNSTFEDSDLVVIRALEVATEVGHVLVFGMHSYVSGMHKVENLRKVVTSVGGVMVSAHPFRNFFNKPPYNVNLLFNKADKLPQSPEEASAHPLFGLVDDIEVANGSNTDEENIFTREVASVLGYRGTGGSDVHSTHGLGKCVTDFKGDIRTEADLIEALREKAFSPAQGLHVGHIEPF